MPVTLSTPNDHMDMLVLARDEVRTTKERPTTALASLFGKKNSTLNEIYMPIEAYVFPRVRDPNVIPIQT